jgi:aspartate aminotransferase-like enzyme
VQNTCSPGDRFLVVNNGFFAQRWVDLARAYGLDVVDLRHEWGEPADPARVAAALAADPSITAAVCVHCETSTGAMSDLRAFGAATRTVLSIVDAASSLGAGELRTDEWDIDVVIGGGQKALGVPAGLGFVTVGERAWRAHETARLPRFYFDWTAARTALVERGATPWTPAVSLITQLDVALQGLLKEGLTEVWRRHERMAAATRAGLTALDLRLTVAADHASPAVTGVWMPDRVDSREVVARMLDEHGIQITGGLGPQTGRVARIGHCGHTDGLDVVMTIAALERTLAASGHEVTFGRGVAAAQQALHAPAVTAGVAPA